MGKRKKKSAPPGITHVAWCALHEIPMTYGYIAKKSCVLKRNCRHFYWLDANGQLVKLNKKKPKEEKEREPC
jgi:hypothetical protein